MTNKSLRSNETVPHYMDSFTKTKHHSVKILGKIFDRVDRQKTKNIDLFELYKESLDEDLIIPGHEDHMPQARAWLNEYNDYLWQLMSEYEVFDEGELQSGFVVALSSRMGRGRKSGPEAQARLGKRLSDLQKYYLEAFLDEYSLFESETWPYDALVIISAFYRATYEQSSNEYYPLLSFPWIFYKGLCQIKVMSLSCDKH